MGTETRPFGLTLSLSPAGKKWAPGGVAIWNARQRRRNSIAGGGGARKLFGLRERDGMGLEWANPNHKGPASVRARIRFLNRTR